MHTFKIPEGTVRNQDEPRFAVVYNHPSGIVIQGGSGTFADAWFKVALAVECGGKDKINCIQRTA